jgi:hypothetical protein
MAFGELQQFADSDALAGSTRSVIADLRQLEFASSSCLKQVVSWLKRVQELDERRRYKVVFRSNPAHSWQRRSLGALADFAAGFVEVTVHRVVYTVLLFSHEPLAVINIPLVVAALVLGLRRADASHRGVAPFAFWIWGYVLVTGIVLYAVLYLPRFLSG